MESGMSANCRMHTAGIPDRKKTPRAAGMRFGVRYCFWRSSLLADSIARSMKLRLLVGVME